MNVVAIKIGKVLDKDFTRCNGDQREVIGLLRLAEMNGHKATFFDRSEQSFEDVKNADLVVVFAGVVDFFPPAYAEKIFNDYKAIRLAQDLGKRVVAFHYDILYALYQPSARAAKAKALFKFDIDPVDHLTLSGKPEMMKSVYDKRVGKFAVGKMERFKLDKLFIFGNGQIQDIAEKTRDLVYVGNYRVGKRAKKLAEFYSGTGAEIFGAWPIEPATGVTYRGKIKNSESYNEIAKSWATVVIGDESFAKYRFYTPRFWETVWNGTVPLIDKSQDPDFYYAPQEMGLHIGKEDVLPRIASLKGSGKYKEIVEKLRETLAEDPVEYWKQLVSACRM
jgi:hypothetical protein